jgi:hypothetical protein
MTQETKIINFTRQKFINLKRAYTNAKKAGKTDNDSFVFEGNQWNIKYCYYMLQHLENKFNS